MAAKRASKNLKTSKVKDYNALILNDALCPICRSILIEPVTLPCNHEFCYSCFEDTMENTNLVCPLCRTRISSWIRKAKKDGNLVNDDLWRAIKDKFPKQVKNKFNGIDENLQEESKIIVAYPGEIRKEYEIQKQREDEDVKRKRDADIKASEELIRKIKEEEDYQKAVMDEKLKLDEQIAKNLAEELSLSKPSTSQIKIINERCGPMDKFVHKDNETVTSQNVQSQKKSINNFLTKEYTCRVLCLDNSDNKFDAHKKVLSPNIKKKIQQIQKIVELDTTSDGSDCIESEMRYFKPIDHRLNPPSQGKPPIKVPSRRPLKNAATHILSPSGLINFHSNILESAFARLSLSIPGLNCSLPITSSTSRLKRTHSDEDVATSKRKVYRKDPENDGKESSTFNNSTKIRKQLFGMLANSKNDHTISPPFFGFENSDRNNKFANCVKVNGTMTDVDEELAKKLLQEKADLEFARKLQDELNRTSYMRSTRRSSVVSRRQATLEEIVKSPYKVKQKSMYST